MQPLILIVDDVLENVHVLGESLAGNCQIQFAESAEEAQRLIARRLPDLILLDVMMPGMSGYEFFSLLKSQPETEQIPVIFVTAKNDVESESEALHAGAADFIHKPINTMVARARVKMHLELAQHRRYLEGLVARKTQELAVALREAEAANAVKTRFMSNVSHEMRTPLQGILGFAQLGQQRTGATMPELARYFDLIERSGQRLQGLVESLLTLAEQTRDEHVRLRADHVESLDLADLLAESVALMSLQAAGRGQSIVFEHSVDDPFIEGDPTRLRQVIEHLLENALRHSPSGERIDVSLRAGTVGAAQQPGLILDILDHGCGIPEAELRAVFEPFYQSSLTYDGAGGTGLGLPLSRCIVMRHGGTLRLSNRPEGGVHCEVALPRKLPAS